MAKRYLQQLIWTSLSQRNCGRLEQRTYLRAAVLFLYEIVIDLEYQLRMKARKTIINELLVDSSGAQAGYASSGEGESGKDCGSGDVVKDDVRFKMK